MPRWRVERKKYEPGYLSKGGRQIYWPEHPLASNWHGQMSLNRLEAWQKRGYRQDHIEILMSGKFQAYDVCFGGPGNTVADNKGYERWYWPGHPLAKGKHPIVFTHHVVHWQESGYDNRVLKLLRLGRASIHHRNTIKNDNRPENLDLRLRHPFGNNKEDWIYLLKVEGYKVIEPEKK